MKRRPSGYPHAIKLLKKQSMRVRESPLGIPPVPAFTPKYVTRIGAAYVADSFLLMKVLPDACVDLVMKPPFALTREKEYGNRAAHEYVDWFMPFAYEVHRILKSTDRHRRDLESGFTHSLVLPNMNYCFGWQAVARGS